MEKGIISNKQKVKVIKKGIIIAHGYLTATGSNYDAQLIVFNNSVYFYNKRDDKISYWDNEDFEIQNKPAYMFTENELIAIAKDV
ncbi:MAG: hypothetical protein PF487_13120 [Bacteroidales bacterium]|jgi:mevalonate kinase|nr:hypothetical protein [Bacteroidales bacterium]